MTNIERFVGAWKLLSWTVSEESKSVRKPYGENPKGYLVYTPQGVVSASLMAENRPVLGTSRPMMTAKIAQALQLMETDGKFNDFSKSYFLSATRYMNYCGTYSVGAHKVTHHVETALIPDWIGTDLVRSFEFKDDRLILSAQEQDVLDQLIWKRVLDEKS